MSKDVNIEWCEILSVDNILKNPKKELSEDNPVKAYKLMIQVPGEEKTRTVVSAIVDLYKPEELLGITTTFEIGLSPKEIRGFLSEGMIFLSVENKLNTK